MRRVDKALGDKPPLGVRDTRKLNHVEVANHRRDRLRGVLPMILNHPEDMLAVVARVQQPLLCSRVHLHNSYYTKDLIIETRVAIATRRNCDRFKPSSPRAKRSESVMSAPTA